MAFTEGSNEGTLSGTTEVTLIPAPGAGVRRLQRGGTIHNRDTAVVTVYVAKKVSGAPYRICAVTLQPGDTLYFEAEDLQVLDATTKSLAAVMSAVPATTNPEFTMSWGDAS